LSRLTAKEFGSRNLGVDKALVQFFVQETLLVYKKSKRSQQRLMQTEALATKSSN